MRTSRACAEHDWARITTGSAFTALGLGVVGMAFERADPAVMSAGPEELAAWARKHHRALTAQSATYLLSTAPLLVFFGGLRACLRPRRGAAGHRVEPSLAVLAGGSAWVLANAGAQTAQVAMARDAARGAPAPVVAAHADRMRALLTGGNAALGGALAATAAATSRDGGLPRWLGRLSAAAALAHVTPLVARLLRGPRPGQTGVDLLPYPLFVAWLVGVAVVLARRGPVAHDSARVRLRR